MKKFDSSMAEVMLKVAQCGLQVLLLLNIFFGLGNFYQGKLLSVSPPRQHHEAEDSLLLFFTKTCYVLVTCSSLCVYG